MSCWFPMYINTNQSLVYMSLPSWAFLPPHTPSHPSGLSQSARLSSRSYTAASHQLSILHMHACMLSCFSHVRLCATLCTAAHQAPLSTGLSRQEYWSGLPFPSPILHMVIYIFQCYSLNLSHLLLPLLCPKVCSLCFYSCPANRFKSIFLVYFTGICTRHESTLEHFHPMLQLPPLCAPTAAFSTHYLLLDSLFWILP